jgi:CheY-like chemotaxis protein
MDEDTLKRAIEPFYSTKGIGKGTGLGLSMVHGLAAQSGGTLILKSTVGDGTTAEIWLPMASEKAPVANGAAQFLAPVVRPVTILLIDDEAIVRSATVAMLSDLGHRVIEASSSAQGLDLLRAGAEPDVVITDYLMPGMNGADLACEIRRDRPDLPILLATGYASLAGNTMADLPLLPKPFRQSELAATIERLVAHAKPSVSRMH